MHDMYAKYSVYTCVIVYDTMSSVQSPPYNGTAYHTILDLLGLPPLPPPSTTSTRYGYRYGRESSVIIHLHMQTIILLIHRWFIYMAKWNTGKYMIGAPLGTGRCNGTLSFWHGCVASGQAPCRWLRAFTRNSLKIKGPLPLDWNKLQEEILHNDALLQRVWITGSVPELWTFAAYKGCHHLTSLT